MARQSEPTRRVIHILRFLADDPARDWPLIEISRELGLSKATLHAILTTLEDTGFVIRSPSTRRYRIGPALIPLGRAALGNRTGVVDAALPIMRRLSARFGSHCCLNAPIDDVIGVLAATGEPARIRHPLHTGQLNHPLIPPLGATFVAWSNRSTIDQWLDGAEPKLDQVERTYYMDVLAGIRKRGFVVSASVDASTRLETSYQAVRSTSEDPSSIRAEMNRMLLEMRTQYYVNHDLEPKRTIDVDWIAVPLFDAEAQVEAALILVNFPRSLRGEEILAAAETLKTGAAEIREIAFPARTHTIPDQR